MKKCSVIDTNSQYGGTELKSMHSVPQWAQEKIVAGAYQQGRADALVWVTNVLLGQVKLP